MVAGVVAIRLAECPKSQIQLSAAIFDVFTERHDNSSL
jgi:hypothetical protein